MITVDTNVLIHANRSETDLHVEARRRLVDLAEGRQPWALPMVAVWGFVRIVTQPIFDPPTPMPQALDFAAQLLDSPSARVLTAGRRHFRLLRGTVEDAGVQGAGLTDAVIVALCREHGVDTVLSADADFRRYPDVRWERLGA